MADYKVLITASGVGLPLGELTRYTNKSLVRVGKKPVLSYVIEAYPEEVELVITVGHFADHIREFISLAYPNRKIALVNVDNYQGEGSSLGYSMLQAKDFLQCPFIYHANDAIITEPIPAPDHNWNGGFKDGSASAFSSFDLIGDKIGEIKDKGALNFDFLHIGLVGIKDYAIFWKKLEEMHEQDPFDDSLNDCRVINAMIKDGSSFKLQDFRKWFDVGNVESLEQARRNIHDSITNLDKVDESIFIFDHFVIKFFHDQKMIEQRVARGKILAGLVPKIENHTKNFFRYEFVPGELYSHAVNPSDFAGFLRWSGKNLWKENKKVSDEEFKKICRDFYITKTLERVKRFLCKKAIKDSENVINGEEVPALEEILSKIDIDWLTRASQSHFHGDFILDNIIKGADRYCLLDWRQNFGGLLEAGDMYYDLAKLNHNLTVNHDVINANLYTIKISERAIECDIMRKENLVACQGVLHDFLAENGYDLRKVKILTAIIWLNMSPLHHHPFDLFLFYFGKLNLWRLVK
jgi:dTDP-glucose pyrophosphorylase